ncbi:NAD(P)-binding protein [Neurospora crassa]|nr:NAD(P)-binding protein [Neurospora crassa]
MAVTDSTVVFISGVGKGIGAGIAKLYLSRPHHIVIGSVRDVSTPSVAELKASPTAPGSKLLLVHIESTSSTDPAAAVEAIRAQGIDHIDIAIANAGAMPSTVPIEEVDTKDMLENYHINAIGPLLLFQALLPLLKKGTEPKWASVSTTAGSIGLVDPLAAWILPAYGGAKAALNWLTAGIASSQKEWMTTIALHPGLVQTGPGNWVAQKVGMGDKAPVTVGDSAASVVKLIDGLTKESNGKFYNAVDGTEVPW